MSPLKRILLSVYLIIVVSSVTLLVTLVALTGNIGSHPTVHKARRAHGIYPHSWTSSMRINLPSYILYKTSTTVVHEGGGRVVYRNSREEDVLKLPWVQELRKFVNNTAYTRSPQVSLVVADRTCLNLLLNWLIAALVRLKDPLQNVVVLGLDSEVCSVLLRHNITCIYTDSDSFIVSPPLSQFKFSRQFVAPQTRLLAGRLLNYWGYSFASYDTDAVVLRNPQSIYDAYSEANVVGGAGQHWPGWAHERWGFAVCPGAVMMRGGKLTEKLWYAISRSWGSWGSEQDQVNRAIKHQVHWNATHPNMTPEDFCTQKTGWRGRMRNMTILLLPPTWFCRGECCDEEGVDFYVSHGRGRFGNFTDKADSAKKRGVWFLREDWQSIANSSTSTGIEWLRQLSSIA